MRSKESKISRSFLFWFLILALATASRCTLAAVHLPLGDINVVIITDDHSWVGGHGAHESLDADYGDVLSFYELLSSATNRSVFLVHNGDWIDGTGLSTYPPVHLEPIVMRMPWDAVTVGNHDIYKNETVMHMTRPGGLVDQLGERYLTSNVVNASTGEPIGHRYRYLRRKNVTVLTFGFMYNLKDIGSPLVKIERVEQVVRSDWFRNVLRSGDYDAVLVLAHMRAKNPSVSTILTAIRSETGPNMPVQFITGHTHIRRYSNLDAWSTAIQAGSYLDTIGFASFSTKQTVSSVNNTAAPKLFQYRFIDAKVDDLRSRLGVKKLKTENGQALTDFIHKTQEIMGLSRVVGCSPQTYHQKRPVKDNDSLFGLWARKIIATQFLPNDLKRVVLQGTASSFRYDLFEGNVTVDDLMVVSPFNDSMYLIASDVPTATIVELDETMNQQYTEAFPGVPSFLLIGDLTASDLHDLYTLEYEVPFIRRALEKLIGHTVEPKPLDVFATSLWLSFIETFWEKCAYANDTTAAKEDDGISFVDKKPEREPQSSPGTVAMFVTITSTGSACILLGRFVLRRLSRRRIVI